MQQRMDQVVSVLCSYLPTSEMGVVLAMEMVAETSRGIFLPSQAIYASLIDSSQAFNLAGVGVATFSAGRLASGLAFGTWSNYAPFRTVFLTALLIGMVGSVLYGIAGPFRSPWLFIAGRFLAGAATGTLAAARSSLSAISAPEERTGVMAWLEGARFVGYALSPGLGILLSLVATDQKTTGWTVFSASVVTMLVLQIAISVLVLSFLDSKFGKNVPTPGAGEQASLLGNEREGVELPSVIAQEEQVEEECGEGGSGDGRIVEEERAEGWLAWLQSPMGTGVVLMIAINLVTRGILAMLEATGASLFLVTFPDKDNDPTSDSSEFFLALGAFGLLIFMALPQVTRRVPALAVLVLGLLLNAVGCLALTPFSAHPISKVALLIGAIFIWSLGQPITSALTVSSFSAMLGSKPQGVWMGVIGAAGSVGRILFPLAIPPPSHSSSAVDVTRTRSTLAVAVAILVLSAITLAVFALRQRALRSPQTTLIQ